MTLLLKSIASVAAGTNNLMGDHCAIPSKELDS
jgi:hypothetical protein